MHKRLSLEMGGKNAHDRHGRRRPRPRARRRALGRVRHDRAALHRHQPADPPPQDSRPVPRAASSTPPRASSSATAARTKTDVGPLIHEASREKVERYVEIGREQGAELVTGRQDAAADRLASGWFFRPTIFAGVRAGSRLEQEEIFGPVLSVVRVGSFDEALRVNNGVRYGLSAASIPAT